MKVLQVNVTLNSGSTGRITEQIGVKAIEQGFCSYIAYSRKGNNSSSNTFKIGNKLDFYKHILETRLLDNHSLTSTKSTENLISFVDKVKPKIIHLHNLHGYYLDLRVLFNYLEHYNGFVIWTLHDCWSFTGHCAHFEDINCEKWKTKCYNCPKKNSYPKSIFIDNSENNFTLKKKYFRLVKNMIIVCPSNWLKNLVSQSFLNKYPIKVIHNGIDLSVFKPLDTIEIIAKYNLQGKKVILGVASVWVKHRGLDDFYKLNKILDNSFKIILVGLSEKQIKDLPKSILGIKRTESVNELAQFYSCANIYLNPTYNDTFPTTNLEALGCGTPVITYNTGGSPEAVDDNTGIIVKKGDVENVKSAIKVILESKDKYNLEYCRNRAEEYFNKENRYQDYISLYNNLLNV